MTYFRILQARPDTANLEHRWAEHGGQSAPIYFTGDDDAGKFREFMDNQPLFEKCKAEYRTLLDRLMTFFGQTGPPLSPPLTAATLQQIRQNIQTLQHTIANPPSEPLLGTGPMYGLGGERFHELAELMDERSSSQHMENLQRDLARRPDVLQTLAPHLVVCSGSVITAVEAALASLRLQNMGIAGKARTEFSRYLRNVVLAQVRSKGNNMPAAEVHRTVAIHNKLAPARGPSPIADQYADWPANQPTPQDITVNESALPRGFVKIRTAFLFGNSLTTTQIYLSTTATGQLRFSRKRK